MKWKFGLGTRLTFYFAILAIIPVVLLTYFFYQTITQLLLQQYALEKKTLVEEQAMIIENFISGEKENILFLSQTASLQKLINTTSTSEKELEKQRLTNNLLQLAKQKSKYYQLRYLDEKGQEVVRIDSYNGQPAVMSTKDLQDKSQHDYFQITNNLAVGEVYVSPLNLNYENQRLENRGTISNPEYVAVIRFATPVFNSKEQRRGIVISNLQADQFLNNLRQISQANNLFLANSQGYFLAHHDRELEFGFEFKKEPLIFKLYQNHIKSAFDRQDSGQYYSQNNQYLVTYNHIVPVEQNVSQIQPNAETWVLFQITPRTEIISQIQQDIAPITLAIAILIVILIGLIPFLTRPFTTTLNEITNAIKQLEKGNYDIKFTSRPSPELKKLIQSFTHLANYLKQSKEETINKMESRTGQLTKMNQFMVNRELKMIELKKEIKELKKQKHL